MRLPLPTALDPHTSPLVTYLNDHLAGSTVGLDLCRRAAAEHEGTELGAFLAKLAGEIEADRGALHEIMDAIGAPADRVKVAVAWAGEKATRMKLMVMSSVSPLEEIEMLLIGITGKLALWRALREIAPSEPRLPLPRIEALIARAEQQVADVEKHRLEAARTSLLP